MILLLPILIDHCARIVHQARVDHRWLQKMENITQASD